MFKKLSFVVVLCLMLISGNVKAISMATDKDLADFRGMCLCCAYNVGAVCSAAYSENDCERAWYGGCQDDGAECRAVYVEASRHDSTAKGVDGNSCDIISSWCVKLIQGNCKDGLFDLCDCEGKQIVVGQRDRAIGDDC